MAGEVTGAPPEVAAADPTRVIVNFSARSVRALDAGSGITGDSKTDTINRSVQLYAFLAGALRDGSELLICRPDGVLERVEVDWGWVR